DGGARCYNLHRVLHSHGALRQPTPHGIFRHIHNVTFHHSHCDANRAETNRAIRTRRIASPPAERLTAVRRETAVSLRSQGLTRAACKRATSTDVFLVARSPSKRRLPVSAY